MRRLLLPLALLFLTSCGGVSNEWPSSQELSETFSGTIVLTEAEPAIEVPVTLTLDGDPAERLHTINVDMQILSYGSSATSADLVLVDHELLEPGEGVVRFTLTQPDASPVEVSWAMQARTSWQPGRQLFDKTIPAQVPVLDVPMISTYTDVVSVAEETVLRLGVGWDNDWDQPQASRFRIATSDEILTIAVPARDPFPLKWPLQFSTEGKTLTLEPGTVGQLELPLRCAVARCEVDLVAMNLVPAPQPFEVRAASGSELVSTEVLDLVQAGPALTSKSPDLAPHFEYSNTPDPVWLTLDVETSSPPQPAAIVWVQATIPQELLGKMQIRNSGIPTSFLTSCCPSVLDVRGYPELENATDQRVNLSVTLWALEPQLLTNATFSIADSAQ